VLRLERRSAYAEALGSSNVQCNGEQAHPVPLLHYIDLARRPPRG
jgi:hypothetical protein